MNEDTAPPITRNQARETLLQPTIRQLELPEVVVPGNGVTVSESSRSLFTFLDQGRELFYQDEVVQIVESVEGPKITPLSAAAAVSEFERFVRFLKRKKAEGGIWIKVPTTINEQLARQYMKSKACRELLPRINGVLKVPLLQKVGSELHVAQNGFDERTGFYIHESRELAAPSLEEAVARILSLIEDYEFATAGDRSRAIASFLTPAMRFGGFITGHVPADVAEADESQSGKTYRQTLVAAVYNEEVRAISQQTGGVGSLDEAFADRLVEGRPFIQFDNVRGKLNSSRLESFLTATGKFAARVPFRPTVNIDPTKYIIFISSNAFQSTEDLANRCSIISIRKRHQVEFKRFEEGRDLREHVLANYEQYLGAMHTIIRHWHSNGEPRTGELRHSFRDWCQKLDWIIQNVFKEAPLMDGHRERQKRTSSPAESFVRLLVQQVTRANMLRHGLSATRLAELCSDIQIPGLNQEKQGDEAAMSKQIGRIMGEFFKEGEERSVDDVRIVRSAENLKNISGNTVRTNLYAFWPPAGDGATVGGG
jgi:hypothetical protein